MVAEKLKALDVEVYACDPFVPEETAKVFKDGYYYTSDLAQILPDGNIVICGRKSDMIKINGNRIEPAEIESAIKSILNIDWCAVKGFVADV